MSGPKARCPSCGTEWDGPVVFCGECGTPVASAGATGDRAARPPPRAHTFVGVLPGVPVSPSTAPPIERRTVMGMTAVNAASPTLLSPIAPPEDGKPKDGARPSVRSSSGKKGRRGSATGEAAVESSPAPRVLVEVPMAAPPSAETPHIEVNSLSDVEAHDAGWTTADAPAPASPPVEAAPPTQELAIEASGDVAAGGAEPQPPAEAAPSRAAPRAHPSVPPLEAAEEQRLLDDLDAGFDSIVRPSEPVDPEAWLDKLDDGRWTPEPPAEPTAAGSAARAARHEADMAEVRDLFAGIAVAYARPLRDFMIEVAWGEPTKEWLDVALPAAVALRRAAAAVELPEVDTALEGYCTALELAGGESSLNREVREMLTGAYGRLVEAMPGVFALEGERGRREPIIVRSLLLQVPGVRKVAIDKLYAAGINGLEVFYAARPRELAEATGLEIALTAAICDRFESYRREVAELSPGKHRERERAEVGELTDDLARHHEAHEGAAASWAADAAARRAEARKDRAETALRIDVLLAHMGEVDLLHALAKLPFQQKIRELKRYLDEAKQKAVTMGAPPPPSR